MAKHIRMERVWDPASLRYGFCWVNIFYCGLWVWGNLKGTIRRIKVHMGNHIEGGASLCHLMIYHSLKCSLIICLYKLYLSWYRIYFSSQNFLHLFFKDLFLFLPVCVYVCVRVYLRVYLRACICMHRGQKKVSDPLELQLQASCMSLNIGNGNWTQVLWKKRQHS